MAIYDINASPLNAVYDKFATDVNVCYDIFGNEVYRKSQGQVDYSNYSYSTKWSSKGITPAQGFDIHDGKVFWVKKSGNTPINADCYVWNLSDGSQALDTAYITIYSGHGNNLDFSDFPKVYTSSAYTSNVCVNTMTDSFVATLDKKLYLNDGNTDCDACLDELENTILWSLGHTANSSDPSAPFIISKWDLTQLTDNGDGTYTPLKLQSVNTPQPANYFFQGCKFHDGLLWYANGNGGVPSYIRAINPNTGEQEYLIDLNTTTEVEGVAWMEESGVAGGYAMYVGFAGMALRRYTFAEL